MIRRVVPLKRKPSRIVERDKSEGAYWFENWDANVVDHGNKYNALVPAGTVTNSFNKTYGRSRTFGSGNSLDSADNNQLEGLTTFSFLFAGNTGTLTNGSGVSPHRFFDKNGGVLAAGLNTVDFRIWNQGWNDIAYAPGNNVDICVVCTYDGGTYRLYDKDGLINTASQTQVTGTGSGALIVGNNVTVGTSGFDWPGDIAILKFWEEEVIPSNVARSYCINPFQLLQPRTSLSLVSGNTVASRIKRTSIEGQIGIQGQINSYFMTAPAVGGLGIPIAAYHHNHNVGSNL